MVTFIALGISGAANAIVHQRDTIVQVSHLPQTCYHNPRGPEGHPKSDGRPHIIQHNIGNKVRQYVANMPSEWQKNTSITLPLPPVPSRNISKCHLRLKASRDSALLTNPADLFRSVFPFILYTLYFITYFILYTYHFLLLGSHLQQRPTTGTLLLHDHHRNDTEGKQRVVKLRKAACKK